ncbi:MAG: hypothetical protein HYU64_06565 [Armatimonadetes bacterium]|nr:hypothetical protein [Armatimonadota bacterium]
MKSLMCPHCTVPVSVGDAVPPADMECPHCKRGLLFVCIDGKEFFMRDGWL